MSERGLRESIEKATQLLFENLYIMQENKRLKKKAKLLIKENEALFAQTKEREEQQKKQLATSSGSNSNTSTKNAVAVAPIPNSKAPAPTLNFPPDFSLLISGAQEVHKDGATSAPN